MRQAILVAALGVALSFASGAGSASGPSFVLGPCPFDLETTQKVDCGTLRVPENRTKPGSRMITIQAAIVHAKSAKPKSDPIVYQNGGQGVPSVVPGAMEVFDGTKFPVDRDVILVDQRGEGSSVPRLQCENLNETDRESFFAQPYIGAGDGPRYAAGVAVCRDHFVSEGVDLSGYNSAEVAADFEDLRRALGIKQWNIWFISADGLVGTTYLRLYPSSIRSAVLDSPQVSTSNLSLDYARGWMEQLEKGLAGCAANAACNAAYPNLRTRLYDLVADLNANPRLFQIDADGTEITVRLTGADFLIYDVAKRANADEMHDAFAVAWRGINGGLQEYLEEILGGPAEFHTYDDFVFNNAYGKALSYRCHDVIAFTSQADSNRLASDYPSIAPLVLSDAFDVPWTPDACKAWDVGRAEPAQHRQFNSPVPTLITIGELDGGDGVPPNISRQIAPSLPNSFTFEFPATGHVPLYPYPGNPAVRCGQKIAEQFLAAPTKRPDSSCIASMPQFDYTP